MTRRSNPPQTVDDLLSPREKEIVADVERRAEFRCPHLRKAGDYFYYCGKCCPENVQAVPDPYNIVCRAHVDLAELQLWCMDADEERYTKCGFYLGWFPSRAESAIAEGN